MTTGSYRIHGAPFSGNCYKAALMLDLLGERYAWHKIDLAKGESRTPEFLAMNPNGKVPVLELPDGRFLAESNAILCYLADGTPYLPADRFARAQTLQWLFFEQYSHEPYIAVARFICMALPEDHPRRAELPQLRERGKQALAVMERHLQAQSWFGGEQCTIADLALFAYTHDAARGGFVLAEFPAVEGWLQRVRELPGFTPQTW